MHNVRHFPPDAYGKLMALAGVHNPARLMNAYGIYKRLCETLPAHGAMLAEETLSGYCFGISPKTLRGYIRILEDAGLMCVTRYPKQKGRNIQHYYRPTPSAGFTVPVGNFSVRERKMLSFPSGDFARSTEKYTVPVGKNHRASRENLPTMDGWMELEKETYRELVGFGISPKVAEQHRSISPKTVKGWIQSARQLADTNPAGWVVRKCQRHTKAQSARSTTRTYEDIFER